VYKSGEYCIAGKVDAFRVTLYRQTRYYFV